MAVLLHISDTHFGTEQVPVLEALGALVRERRPDVLVFSGDLTQRARPSQFAAARRMCESFDIGRMLALPGNHDIPLFDVATRVFRPYGNYLRDFGPQLDPWLDLDDFLVIGVNTTRPRRHKDGEVSQEQIERVATLLKAARPGQLRVVVTHQPAEVIRAEDEKDRLHNAEPALQAWSAAGADLVLGGHIHLPYIKDLRERSQPTPRATWVVQAGTAVSSRLRHGTCNSVNVVQWRPLRAGEPRRCLVERCDYDVQEGWFNVKASSELALD